MVSPRSHPDLGLAGVIVLGWLASLIALLSLDLHQAPWWALITGILVRTHLHTGLFIVGHDAMHRLLWRSSPRCNDLLGSAMLALYAGLSYSSCRENHRRHHQFPATRHDPDFAAAEGSGLLSWYSHFMAGYLNALQMVGLLSTWALLAILFRFVTASALLNVLVFCTLPLLLSSLQLFVFGTYLPHRRQRAPAHSDHPDSLGLPCWLSLLACFHFGYHREHHDNPGLAWWQLPAARRRALSLTAI